MQTPHGPRHTLPPARRRLLLQRPSELETWPPNWRTRNPVVPWLCLVRGPGPAPGVHEAGLEALYSLARWWLHCICSRGLAVAAGDEAVMHASINDLQCLRCCCGIFLQVGGVRSIPASLSKNRAAQYRIFFHYFLSVGGWMRCRTDAWNLSCVGMIQRCCQRR